MGRGVDCMSPSVRGLSLRPDCVWKVEWVATLSHLGVLRYDAHPEVQDHVHQKQRVREHVEALPRQPAVAVQEGDLHGNPDQVQEGDGHHDHDVVTPAGGQMRK